MITKPELLTREALATAYGRAKALQGVLAVIELRLGASVENERAMLPHEAAELDRLLSLAIVELSRLTDGVNTEPRLRLA